MEKLHRIVKLLFLYRGGGAIRDLTSGWFIIRKVIKTKKGERNEVACIVFILIAEVFSINSSHYFEQSRLAP